jgi:predicted nucleic acid-binding protein
VAAAELLVDTSAWYPLADRAHPDHARLAEVLRDRVAGGIRIVTTNLLVAESHALLLRRAGRGAALRFLNEVVREPILVVTSSPEIEARARDEWLKRYDDQDFTLADGVSFAVMTERGIGEALALDRHFATAGFRMIPAG